MRPLFAVLLVTSTAIAAPKPGFLDRLPDPDGPVPGLPGFSIKHKPSAKYCGGTQVVTTRAKHVAPDDQRLAAVFAIEFPTGLDFSSSDDKRKQASMRTFNTWLEKMQKTAAAAREQYDRTLAAATSDTAAKVAAAAHMAQIAGRIATVIGRAEIPVDVRSGAFKDDQIQAYCAALQTAAEPLLDQAEAAMRVCAQKAKDLPAGSEWWRSVCVEPAAKP